MLITNKSIKHPDFEITLNTGQQFLQNLNPDQQYWTMYKAMREFGKRKEVKSINQLELSYNNVDQKDWSILARYRSQDS